jgi:hypothetical protein
MKRLLISLALTALAAPAFAQPLTMRTGETWIFSIDQGEPAHARKVDEKTLPARGELKASVRSLFGTMMTISNNGATAYTYEAQVIGADGKAVTGKTCTLPTGNKPSLESWPQKAVAVRIGKFRATGAEGRC